MGDLPEPPSSLEKWLLILKKINDYNIVSLLVAAIVLWAYWQQGKKLEESEARTRAALTSCTERVTSESKSTRAEVRAKAADLKRELQPAQ